MHFTTVLVEIGLKAHSHRARLRPSIRPSTGVDALGVNAQAFFHVFHIGVDARRRTQMRGARRATDVDGHRRARCEWVFWVYRVGPD